MENLRKLIVNSKNGMFTDSLIRTLSSKPIPSEPSHIGGNISSFLLAFNGFATKSPLGARFKAFNEILQHSEFIDNLNQ